MRISEISRTTKETGISCRLNLDGTGKAAIETGVGFFDHMLQLFAFHGSFDLSLRAEGDLHVDDHHTIEDCGIVLGQAFREALQEKKGIARYGFFRCPMDGALAEVTLDISGRPYLVFNASFSRERIGTMATEMAEEFFRAFAVQAGITLHIGLLYGSNDHHCMEAVFKAFGHALSQAVKVEGNRIPSSKGVLE